MKIALALLLLLSGCGGADCPIWCLSRVEVDSRQTCFVGPSCGTCTVSCNRISQKAALDLLDAGQCVEGLGGVCR